MQWSILVLTVNDLFIPVAHGEAFYLKNQQTVVTNCFIVNNSSSFGGGIYSFASHTEVNTTVLYQAMYHTIPEEAST